MASVVASPSVLTSETFRTQSTAQKPDSEEFCDGVFSSKYLESNGASGRT
jgi:hypothetical protein